ncbi:MAG TPA: hypothetical protein VIP51_11220 [Eoetvoesiella sp.]
MRLLRPERLPSPFTYRYGLKNVDKSRPDYAAARNYTQQREAFSERVGARLEHKASQHLQIKIFGRKTLGIQLPALNEM